MVARSVYQRHRPRHLLFPASASVARHSGRRTSSPLWDAQRRAGISDEQITQAMVKKLVVNKQREWPEPKDGEPRQHIKTSHQRVLERKK